MDAIEIDTIIDDIGELQLTDDAKQKIATFLTRFPNVEIFDSSSYFFGQTDERANIFDSHLKNGIYPIYSMSAITFTINDNESIDQRIPEELWNAIASLQIGLTIKNHIPADFDVVSTIDQWNHSQAFLIQKNVNINLLSQKLKPRYIIRYEGVVL